jgi:hypothetical protein
MLNRPAEASTRSRSETCRMTRHFRNPPVVPSAGASDRDRGRVEYGIGARSYRVEGDHPDMPSCKIAVRLLPRARVNEIAGERDGALVVRVTAPPVGGRANAALPAGRPSARVSAYGACRSYRARALATSSCASMGSARRI